MAVYSSLSASLARSARLLMRFEYRSRDRTQSVSPLNLDILAFLDATSHGTAGTLPPVRGSITGDELIQAVKASRRISSESIVKKKVTNLPAGNSASVPVEGPQLSMPAAFKASLMRVA